MNLDLRQSTQFCQRLCREQCQPGWLHHGRAGGAWRLTTPGVIFARYTNGQSMVQGQVVLANFANVQGLTPVGKTAWVQSFESGEPVVGTPRIRHPGGFAGPVRWKTPTSSCRISW